MSVGSKKTPRSLTVFILEKVLEPTLYDERYRHVLRVKEKKLHLSTLTG